MLLGLLSISLHTNQLQQLSPKISILRLQSTITLSQVVHLHLIRLQNMQFNCRLPLLLVLLLVLVDLLLQLGDLLIFLLFYAEEFLCEFADFFILKLQLGFES